MNIISIKSRLKSYSEKYNQNHHYTLIRFFQERYLYRLSLSEYKSNFLLKGGALIYVYGLEEVRYTRDIDFLLTKLESSHEIIYEIFYDVGKIDTNDGVEYLVDDMTVCEIKKDGKYKGVRVKIPSKLGNIKEGLQIDIGVGDYVTPGPQIINYPTLLSGFGHPELYAYSIETSIAEKLEAMISLGEYNSRLKDFYDIYYLVSKCSKEVLGEAIINTFKRRKTPLIKDHPIFSLDFYEDKKRVKRWKLFLEKNELNQFEFDKVYEKIKCNFEPLYNELISKI